MLFYFWLSYISTKFFQYLKIYILKTPLILSKSQAYYVNIWFKSYNHLVKTQQYNVADKNPIVVGAAIGFLKILSVTYSPAANTNSCQISFILC